MTDKIVWHVAEVIAHEYFRDPVAVFDFHALDLNLQDEYRNMARAAIRATLEYARDNPDEYALDAGAAAMMASFQEGFSPSHCEGVFKAMLDSLIKEIEGVE